MQTKALKTLRTPVVQYWLWAAAGVEELEIQVNEWLDELDDADFTILHSQFTCISTPSGLWYMQQLWVNRVYEEVQLP